MKEKLEEQECTFSPNIARKSSTKIQDAPKGFVESISRLRDAHTRKEELKKVQDNLGKLGQGQITMDMVGRVDGKLVPIPFKFNSSTTYLSQQKERRLEEEKLREE